MLFAKEAATSTFFFPLCSLSARRRDVQGYRRQKGCSLAARSLSGLVEHLLEPAPRSGSASIPSARSWLCILAGGPWLPRRGSYRLARVPTLPSLPLAAPGAGSPSARAASPL